LKIQKLYLRLPEAFDDVLSVVLQKMLECLLILKAETATYSIRGIETSVSCIFL